MIELVIAGEDRMFNEKLADYINTRHFHNIKVTILEDPKLLSGLEKVDIYLLSPMFSDFFDGTDNAVIVIAEDLQINNFKGRDTVFKYQHAEKTVSCVINKYNSLDKTYKGSNMGHTDTYTVSVCSPSGGTGKTTFSVALCVRLAIKGYKVFYLNFENISSVRFYFSSEDEGRLSKLLLALKDKDSNLHFIINGMKIVSEIGDLHYFPLPESMSELYEVEKGEYLRLLEAIRSMGFYDYLIIDNGQGMDPLTNTAMQQSNRIFLISRNSRMDENRLDLMLKGISKKEGIYHQNLDERLVLLISELRMENSCDAVELYSGGYPSGRLPRDDRLDFGGLDYFRYCGHDYNKSIDEIIYRYIDNIRLEEG